MAALYRQVYERIRSDIESGRLEVGDRLPTEAVLADDHQVSTVTVKKALDLLRQDGMIMRRPRLGTFVTRLSPTEGTAADAAPGSLPLVGCVLTNFDDSFGTELLGSMLDTAAGRANLIVRRSAGSPRVEEQLITELVANQIQALVLEPSSSEYVPPVVLELVTRRFPVVIVDRALDRLPVSTVCSDNLAAARMLTGHLFDLGHRRVGLVSAATHVSTLDDRRQGFLLAHATLSAPHDESTAFTDIRSTQQGLDGSAEDDIVALQAHLRAHPELTGFVATEYNIALLLHEACRRNGLVVPGDVSIVCFDHPMLPFDLSAFRFTHARQDQVGLGRSAVEQSLAQIDTPDRVDKVALETTLVTGESTRRVGRRPAKR